MVDEWVRDEPHLIEKDYKTKYTKPVVENHKWGQDWYLGTGIVWEKHPLKRHIPKWAGSQCGNCKSENTKIIAAQWSVSYASGDAYWDIEIYCEDCRKYTQRAYAEND